MTLLQTFKKSTWEKYDVRNLGFDLQKGEVFRKPSELSDFLNTTPENEVLDEKTYIYRSLVLGRDKKGFWVSVSEITLT
jgi:hypothetical protein